MRILVVEDKESHRKSAEETLVEHNVTIVKSYDEAVDLMERKIDGEKYKRLLAEAGFLTQPNYEKEGQERWDAYWKARNEAEERSVIPFPFDVVLTDMMMPMSKRTLASGVFNPTEQVPYGFVIALKATLVGAKFVAMVTDTNHHKSAMSAAIDHFGPSYYNERAKPNFTINGAKVMFVHTPFVQKITKGVPCDRCKETGVCSNCNGTGLNNDPKWQPRECHSCSHTDAVGKCTQCKGTGRYDRTDTLDTKDWGRVLADLIA